MGCIISFFRECVEKTSIECKLLCEIEKTKNNIENDINNNSKIHDKNN